MIDLLPSDQTLDVSYPGCYEERHHMSKCEKDVTCGSRGRRLHKGPPDRLLGTPLPLILFRGGRLVPVMTPDPVLRSTEDSQSVAGAGASQHPCCRSCPFQPLPGEAPPFALRGRRVAAAAFPRTLGAVFALAVSVLGTWAQSCHEQQTNPQREQLPLVSHYCRAVTWKKPQTSARVKESFYFTWISSDKYVSYLVFFARKDSYSEILMFTDFYQNVF